MRKTIAVILLFLLAINAVCAQVFVTSGLVENDAVIVYGSKNLSNSIPYNVVNGSPFWNDEWKPAMLYDFDGKSLGKYKVKINQASQDLHFLSPANNEELVADPKTVKQIVFYIDDSYKMVEAVFQCGLTQVMADGQKKDPYLQILNWGDAQLLKLTVREVKSADSMLSTRKRYYFKKQDFYYLSVDNKLKRIKSLDRETVLFAMPGASLFSDWIAENKIDFKNEVDVIRFLAYYNSHAAK